MDPSEEMRGANVVFPAPVGSVRVVDAICMDDGTSLLYTGKGMDGDLFLILLIEIRATPEGHANRWLLVPISTETRDALVSNTIPLQSGFKQPEGGVAHTFLLERKRGGWTQYEPVPTEKIEDAWLPDPDVFWAEGVA